LNDQPPASILRGRDGIEPPAGGAATGALVHADVWNP
jgi:hypothetical protein